MSKEIEYLLHVSLGCRPGDRLCLIRDKSYELIASQIISYCRENNIQIEEILHLGKSVVSSSVKNAFLSDSNNVILLASEYNLWHSEYRKDAKYKMNKRLVNLLHPDSPCPSYLTDISKMSELGKRVKDILEETKETHLLVRIITEDGTNLVSTIGKIFCETGEYFRPQSGGDYPAGEVGFGPKEGSVNGILNYNYKIQHLGFIEDSNIIKVENDKITHLRTSDDFKKLIAQHDAFNYISEISIGINSLWSETSNVNSIIEEKNLGTVHLGHGGNFPSYGYRRGPHFDVVLKRPSLYLGTVELINNGVFNGKYLNL
ncbi:MAG: hypothetical protein ACP5OA_05830 [Candidatus Woesearchaeota archaeon]